MGRELRLDAGWQCEDCGQTLEFSGLTATEIDQEIDKHVCERES